MPSQRTRDDDGQKVNAVRQPCLSGTQHKERNPQNQTRECSSWSKNSATWQAAFGNIRQSIKLTSLHSRAMALGHSGPQTELTAGLRTGGATDAF